MAQAYKKDSITLPGAVAMGTGVMIGAGIFALTGQIAELAGPLIPLRSVPVHGNRRDLRKAGCRSYNPSPQTRLPCGLE